MKAIVFDQPGAPDVLRYDDAPDPQASEDELLVRVRAAGINRADLMQRRGRYAVPPGASPILGMELAGEVEQAAGAWQVGDRVMAVVTGGAYAQKAVVPVGMAMRIPDLLSFEEAAAIPEAFLTAYLNMFMLGQLQAGETVLIHAGASGVGTAAIQLARAAGARVLVTVGSEKKAARCLELGAEAAIQYKQESFVQRVAELTDKRGVDVILDFIGAPYWNDNLASLATYGRLTLIGFLGGSAGQLDLGLLMGKSLSVYGTTLRPTPLPRKTALVRAFSDFALDRFKRGDLRPVIHAVYSLREVSTAHTVMEANENVGKILLRMD